MSAENDVPELSTATYSQLYNLDNTFESIDAITAAFQEALSKPVLQKRAELAKRIPNFWPLVFEQAPPDVDQYIQPTDSNVLAEHLVGFHVERFESKASPEAFAALLKASKDEVDEEQFGEPLSLAFRFEFKENEYFEDKILEKKFYYRRSIEGEGEDPPTWSGRVSEPVKIRWKPGKDLSEGMTDAAYTLWQAQQKAGLLDANDHETAKANAEKIKELPEFKALEKKVDESTEGSQSFFTWFSYHGPWVSVAQDKLARAYEKEQAKKPPKEEAEAGADAEDEDVGDLDEMPPHLAVEVFPDGEELALALAEDIWPNAIKGFLEAQGDGDEDMDMSGGSFDEADLEELDEEQDEAAANMAQIRGLSKKSDKDAPPSKRRKT